MGNDDMVLIIVIYRIDVKNTYVLTMQGENIIDAWSGDMLNWNRVLEVVAAAREINYPFSVDIIECYLN